MFGFKIIPEKLLSGMEQSLKDLYGRNKFLTNENECLQKKLVSLKIRMSETLKKLDFANLYVLHGSDYKCEACKLESQHCKKLHFADRTICVVPKDKVNSFTKKNKNQENKAKQ